MGKETCTAIVLAAGKGSRMGTKVHKQYLEMAGKPVLYYSLRAFQKSEIIDEILLVTGAGEEEYCRETIVDRYGFTKVKRILPGGAQRYHSVHRGLQAMEGEGYVFIHDGARPFVSEEIIARAYEQAQEEKACVVGMPVKDTIKIADDRERVADTPDRSRLWMIQTPQVFEKTLVKTAYEALMEKEDIQVTDDAMVVEMMADHPVKLVRGSYENIKITTPEDLKIGEMFVKSYFTEE